MLPDLHELDRWEKGVVVRQDVMQQRMREYGALCRKQGLEEATHVCDNEKWDHQTGAYTIRYIDIYNGACDDCMKAIGRLS